MSCFTIEWTKGRDEWYGLFAYIEDTQTRERFLLMGDADELTQKLNQLSQALEDMHKNRAIAERGAMILAESLCDSTTDDPRDLFNVAINKAQEEIASDEAQRKATQ